MSANDVALHVPLVDAVVTNIHPPAPTGAKAGFLRCPGPEACQAIAVGLNVDPVIVFRVAGLLPPSTKDLRESDPQLDEAARLFTALDEHQRTAALQMLRGLANATNQPTHASTTPEPEHSGIPEAEKLRPDEPDHLDEGTKRRLIAFYSLMDHSTPAEWEVYSQSLDEIRQNESKQEGRSPKGTEESGGLREIVKE